MEAADLDEALAWGRKAAIACRAPVEAVLLTCETDVKGDA